jgi:hypothetical protein
MTKEQFDKIREQIDDLVRPSCSQAQDLLDEIEHLRFKQAEEVRRAIDRNTAYEREIEHLERRLADCEEACALKTREIERLRAILADIVRDGGNDPNSHAYLGEAMLKRIGAAAEPRACLKDGACATSSSVQAMCTPLSHPAFS